jgi:hypothetical protein
VQLDILNVKPVFVGEQDAHIGQQQLPLGDELGLPVVVVEEDLLAARYLDLVPVDQLHEGRG